MYPRDLKRLKIHIIPLKGVPKNGDHTEEIVEGIKHGVRKVNIDTDLRLAATGAIRRYMAQNPAEFDPRKYLAETTKAMRDIANCPLRSLWRCGTGRQNQAAVTGSHVPAL